ncbi:MULTISPECIES: terminase [Shewanella]|uniref:terminase n=1 Tax=Shewanella TaxID=22 RepID=UPI001AAEEB92|nr:terminase [Shewanella algae]MBO2580248.1 terminase [Shewanella algae]HDS1207835.1 terminase [Shewanella algae]
MAIIKSVRSDPRFPWLVKKFRFNWLKACIVLFGFLPSHQQVQLIAAAQKVGARVSVSSGHGTGKSSVIACLVLIFLLTHPNGRVILVANKLDQVKIGVMKNVKAYYKKLCERLPWIGNYFTLTEEMFYENTSGTMWSLGMKSCRPGNEESLAGEHGKHLLWIVDEASGLSNKAFEYIDGSLTEEDNRVVLLSQPTRDSGYFWETHNIPAMAAKWVRLIFNSEESPFVRPKFIADMFVKCGCNRDDVQYMIRVRGLFPKSLKGYLISSDQMRKAAVAKPRLAADWGWVMTVDVGNGRDSSVINIGRVSGDREQRKVVKEEVIEFPGTIEPVALAYRIINIVNSDKYPNISVVIDGDGIGAATATLVENAGIPVQRIRWGLPPFSKSDRRLYVNLRAFAHIQAANAIKSGRMRIDGSAKTRAQGSRLPWLIDEMGRWKIVSKEVMREKMGIKSPDIMDTYCFFFLASYVPASMITDERTMEERESSTAWATGVSL